MKVEASLNNLKITPRKVRTAAYAVRGLNVAEASIQLDKMLKKASLPLIKLLQSAIANAEHNFNLDRSNLYVDDVWVGDGPRLKRWLPRAQGRATALWRRMSRVRIVLAEREEGKRVAKHVSEEKSSVKEAAVKEGKAASKQKTGKGFTAKSSANAKVKGGSGFAKKTFQRKAV